MYPLAGLLVFCATLAVLVWNIPIFNPVTGTHENIGRSVKRGMQNILNPRLSLSNAFPNQRLINVLLVGLDHVPERKGEGDAIRRSDSVILAATDISTKQIRLLSIPRDGWVEQVGESGKVGFNKLAHSYANGQIQKPDDPYAGIMNTRDAVTRLTGIEPQYFVVIQFEGLAAVVDALGGLDVDVEKDMNYDDRRGNLHIHFKQGPQHMTGEQVVQYARFRHDMLGDITRMGRQQTVIRLLLEKAMSMANSRSPQQLLQVKNAAQRLNECVLTNFTLDQLLALAQHIDDYSPLSIQSQTLQSYGPQDPQYPDHLRGETGGMAVQAMLPEDVDKARAFVTNLEPPPPPTVEGVDGTPADGAQDGSSPAPESPADGDSTG